MKKLFALTTAAMLMLSTMSVTALANDGVTLVVNGETVDFTDDQEPVIQNGRTLVPFRAAFEKMGAEVNWYNDIRLCEAVYGDTTVGIKIDDTKVTLGDGSEIESDVPAQIINSRTMVPLRILSESIGAKVDWDGDTKTITVTTSGITGEAPSSVKYSKKTGTAAGKTKVTYSYPVITDTYTAAELLNKNITADISNAVAEIASRSESDATELDVIYDVKYNDSGVFSVMYYIDGETIYWCHYAISTGARISDDEYVKISGLNIDEVKVDVGEDDPVVEDEVVVDESTVENNRYTIAEYTANAKNTDGEICITATTHYPQFIGDDEITKGLNYQLEKSAKKGVDSFIASYKDNAIDVYDNATEHLYEVPYEFVENCEVEISDDNIATIKTDFSEVKYNEEVRNDGGTIQVDLTTGLVIE
jgi:hypothetical protein